MSKEPTGVQSREDLYAVQDGKCFYCCKHISLGKFHHKTRRNGYTDDHFFPRCALERHMFSNIVLACERCNNKKGDRMPSNKALLKFERLLQLRKRYPRIGKAESGRVSVIRLPYF